MRKEDEEQGSKRVLGRRDFLKFTGTAVSGALAIGAKVKDTKNARQVTVARKKHHKC